MGIQHPLTRLPGMPPGYCTRCHGPPGRFSWVPDRDFGVVITDGPRLVKEEGRLIRALLVR